MNLIGVGLVKVAEEDNDAINVLNPQSDRRDEKILNKHLSFASLKNGNRDPEILSPKASEMNPNDLAVSPEINLEGSPMMNRNDSKKLYDTQALCLKPQIIKFEDQIADRPKTGDTNQMNPYGQQRKVAKMPSGLTDMKMDT